MDETSWKIVQIGMWVIGGQTAILGFLFLFIWNNFSKKIEEQGIFLKTLFDKVDRNEAKLNAKLDSKFDPLLHSINELDKRINELDKRLYGIETVLHMKDCCILKQDQNLKQAQ